MPTTKSELALWYFRAPNDATHMIVICDTFDYEDYPSYITATADEARAEVDRLDGTQMRRVMEVYNLNMDLTEQLNQGRAWNY